jgi:hypothetical protein
MGVGVNGRQVGWVKRVIRTHGTTLRVHRRSIYVYVRSNHTAFGVTHGAAEEQPAQQGMRHGEAVIDHRLAVMHTLHMGMDSSLSGMHPDAIGMHNGGTGEHSSDAVMNPSRAGMRFLGMGSSSYRTVWNSAAPA